MPHIPEEKNASSTQLPIAPQLGMGLCEYAQYSLTTPFLAFVQIDFVQIVSMFDYTA